MALWPGEVQQYLDLQGLTDGTKGGLLARTPLEWAFRRDLHDTGVASGWAYGPVDLSYWRKKGREYSVESRKDYPTTEWEMLRTVCTCRRRACAIPTDKAILAMRGIGLKKWR